MSPLRIAVLGTNFISDWFVTAARDVPEVEVTAVVSRARETADAFGAKHGIEKRFVGLDAALSDAEVDAIYVATPNGNHPASAIAASRAGKHVLCEKIIAPTRAEFLAMKEAAGRAGKVLLEAMRPTFDPLVRVFKDALPTVGKIRRAYLPFCQYSSRYDKFKAGIYTNAFDPKLGNCALFDIGIYPLSLSHFLFGAPDAVYGKSVFLPGGFEGSGELLLDYAKDGFLSSVVYAKTYDSPLPVTVEGEGGILTMDKVSAPTVVTRTLRGGEAEVLARASVTNNMVYEIRTFAAVCRGEQDGTAFLNLSDSVMQTVDTVVKNNGIFA